MEPERAPQGLWPGRDARRAQRGWSVDYPLPGPPAFVALAEQSPDGQLAEPRSTPPETSRDGPIVHGEDNRSTPGPRTVEVGQEDGQAVVGMMGVAGREAWEDGD